MRVWNILFIVYSKHLERKACLEYIVRYCKLASHVTLVSLFVYTRQGHKFREGDNGLNRRITAMNILESRPDWLNNQNRHMPTGFGFRDNGLLSCWLVKSLKKCIRRQSARGPRDARFQQPRGPIGSIGASSNYMT